MATNISKEKKDFAELVGLNSKSVTNYAQNGEVPVHWAIVVAIIMVYAHNKVVP